MLVDPGACDILMASGASVVPIRQSQAPIRMRIVAVETADSALADRVMGRILKLGSHGAMALCAHLRGRIGVAQESDTGRPQVFAFSDVRIVTVGTQEARSCMLAAVPLEMGRMTLAVALQAILARGKADVLHGLGIGVLAAEAVAGLALRVVGRDLLVPLHLFVTHRTFFAAHPFGADDGLDPAR